MQQWAKNYFTGMFFSPLRQFSSDIQPGSFPNDAITFPGPDNRKLAGFFFKPAQTPIGTVVHCHGNTGRVENHIPLIYFLIEAGFNVLCFDYGGYGDSEGTPTPPGIVEDALAALDYGSTLPGVDKNKIALFGQSLGGAAAAGAMARNAGVKCLVLEGTFSTYLGMAKEKLLGKILFPITPHVIPDVGPLHDLKKIGPRKVLVVHGEADTVVPAHFSKELQAAYPDFVTLRLFKNLGHLEAGEDEPGYRQCIIDFLKQHL